MPSKHPAPGLFLISRESLELTFSSDRFDFCRGFHQQKAPSSCLTLWPRWKLNTWPDQAKKSRWRKKPWIKFFFLQQLPQVESACLLHDTQAAPGHLARLRLAGGKGKARWAERQRVASRPAQSLTRKLAADKLLPCISRSLKMCFSNPSLPHMKMDPVKRSNSILTLTPKAEWSYSLKKRNQKELKMEKRANSKNS